MCTWYMDICMLEPICHCLDSLDGLPSQFVHMIPAFTSSNTLTGRTGRLHIFQTLVPSYRAQVFI